MKESEAESERQLMRRLANSDLPEMILELVKYCEDSTLDGDEVPLFVDEAKEFALLALMMRGTHQ